MRASWRRAAKIIVAATTVSVIPLLSGCKTDTQKANEALDAELVSATGDLQNGATDSAMKTLAKAASSKAASPDSQINANSLLAQSEVNAADTLLRHIEQQDAQIAGVVAQMESLAGQIDLNNVFVAGYRSLDPSKGPLNSLQQLSNAAEQGDNGQWMKGNPPVPALSQVKQNEQTLQKQIDDLKAQKQELARQRAQALQDAEKFSRQSETTTGQDSQGFFIQAVNRRKEAADNQAKMEAIDGQLVPLNQQLQVAQAQQQVIEGALASLKQDATLLQNGWQSIQKQIEAANSFSDSLLNGSGGAGGGGTPAATAPAAGSDAAAAPSQAPAPAEGAGARASLAALGTQLEQLVTSAQADRSKAVELLNSAFQHEDTALNLAINQQKDLTKQASSPDVRKLPEYRAWQEMLALNHPSGFKVQQALIQQRLGRLYAGKWVEESSRNRMTRLLSVILQRSGLQIPQSLAFAAAAPAASQPTDPQLEQVAANINKADFADFSGTQKALEQIASSQTAPAAQPEIDAARANLAYAWADNLANDAATTAAVGAGNGVFAPQVGNIAHMVRMADQYNWAVFAQAQGKTQEYDSRLKTAQAERDALKEANALALLPPVLPPQLAFATTALATSQPTSAPSVNPAGTPETPTAIDTPEVADVRRVALDFFTALVSGDSAKAIGMMEATDPQTSQSIKQASDMMTTMSSFKSAVLAKFGDKGNEIVAGTGAAPNIGEAKIEITGDTAKVSSPGGPELLTLKRVGDTWKVQKPSENEMAIPPAATQMVAAYKQLTADITAGKYATVDDLKAAMQPALGPTTSPGTTTAPTTAPAQ